MWWICNRLGVRRVIPSCASWVIRIEYPEDSGFYVPFMESKMNDQHEGIDDDDSD